MRPRSVSIEPALLQRAQQHDGAGDRERQAEDEPGAGRPAQSTCARPQPSTVATAICAMAPGTAMARTDSRSFSEKCRPTPNISRMTPISASSVASDWSATKPGVNGPTSDAGEQIADQRRDAEAVGEGAEDEGEPEAGDDGGDKRRIVRHGPVLVPNSARSLPRACVHLLRPSEAGSGSGSRPLRDGPGPAFRGPSC